MILIYTLNAGLVPTIVGFKEIYQQVRQEEGEVTICLMRERNLYREDTITVVIEKKDEGQKLDSGWLAEQSNHD